MGSRVVGTVIQGSGAPISGNMVIALMVQRERVIEFLEDTPVRVLCDEFLFEPLVTVVLARAEATV
jgi:hypothetical protein